MCKQAELKSFPIFYLQRNFLSTQITRLSHDVYDIIINMQDIYEKFEFSKITEKLASYTKTQGGKHRALELRMFDNSIALERELEFLKEMISVMDRYGKLPIQVSSDLQYALTLAKKGGCLGITDLERVASDILLQADLRRFFKQVTESPLLLDYISHFPNISYIESAIHRVIAPDLSIFDNASSTLQNVRHAMKHLEAQMKKKLNSILESNKEYLSDMTLTLKNGHYVLPVANAHKSKVRGIVQDVSNSGGTTFIEPAILVEMNNKMVELQNEEREEIHRLLMELTIQVLNHEDEVLESNKMIAYLDFLMAKSNFAIDTDAHVAILSKKPIVDIMNARHPLLDPKKVVPNDFMMNEKTSLIVISGPNAGGKTVSLKTVGIAAFMNTPLLNQKDIKNAVVNDALIINDIKKENINHFESSQKSIVSSENGQMENLCFEQKKELASIGVKEELINSEEFKNFKKQFNSNTYVKSIYELYAKTMDKPHIEKMGSMKNGDTRQEKDYYTPEEVDRLTEEDYDDPVIFNRVRESMKKW